MATGSEGRGTVKKGGSFRTPRLSAAQKRSNKIDRSLRIGKKTTGSGNDVPF